MSLILAEETDMKELEKISFADPFQESLRKTRRNLLLVSVIGILIGTFPIEITSFMGVDLLGGRIRDVYIRGIINLIVIYHLISFGLSLIIDLYAWDFKKERVRVKHYLDIQKGLDGIIDQMMEEDEDEDSTPTKTNHSRDKFWSSLQKRFKGTLSGLTIRFVARVFSIFLVDILTPITLGCIAIYKTRHGLLPLMENIFG